MKFDHIELPKSKQYFQTMSYSAYKPPAAPPPPSWSDDLTSGLKIKPLRDTHKTWSNGGSKGKPPDPPVIPGRDISSRYIK